MNTLRYKLEKKGYKIIHNIGYKNGEQQIVSISAKKGMQAYKAPNITQLYNIILKS